MTPEEAIELVVAGFPFEKYTDDERGAYLTIARSVLRHLPRGATVLDFGCGPCDKTAVVQHLGYRCYACDDLGDDWHGIAGAKDRIVRFAQANGIEFRIAPDGVPPFEQPSFDLLMMLDVLEHLHDSPRDLLNDLLLLVKPQGLFLATVPNAVNIRKRLDVLRGRTNLPRFAGYYWYPGRWRGHIREYVRGDLIQLAEYLGLEIVELRGWDHMLHRLPGPARPIYRAVTSLVPGWKDSWLLVARKKAGWIPRKTLPPAELAAILGTSTPFQY